jgi:hypothetical protein
MGAMRGSVLPGRPVHLLEKFSVQHLLKTSFGLLVVAIIEAIEPATSVPLTRAREQALQIPVPGCVD